MAKKSRPKALLTKSNVTFIMALSALVLSAVSILFLTFFWDTFIRWNNQNGDQMFDLYVKSAQHDLCFENSIKPCNQETIKKFYDAQQ